MNCKLETIVQIIRKIIQLIVVVTLKSTNEYHQKIISKSGRKMDLYLAMCLLPLLTTFHFPGKVGRDVGLIRLIRNS